MKIKTLSELLVWSRDLQLNEDQQEAVIGYIGGLEQIINEKYIFIDKIFELAERAEKIRCFEKGIHYERI